MKNVKCAKCDTHTAVPSRVQGKEFVNLNSCVTRGPLRKNKVRNHWSSWASRQNLSLYESISINKSRVPTHFCHDYSMTCSAINTKNYLSASSNVILSLLSSGWMSQVLFWVTTYRVYREMCYLGYYSFKMDLDLQEVKLDVYHLTGLKKDFVQISITFPKLLGYA